MQRICLAKNALEKQDLFKYKLPKTPRTTKNRLAKNTTYETCTCEK